VTSDAKPVQLIDHRVDGVFQLENFAFDVDGDLAREVAARDRGGDFAMFRTWPVRLLAMKLTLSVAPSTYRRRPALGLASEVAFGPDLAGDARHFRREAVQLIDHGVSAFP
jgi:hypothetical protein